MLVVIAVIGVIKGTMGNANKTGTQDSKAEWGDMSLEW
jgi:hypothetical protein